MAERKSKIFSYVSSKGSERWADRKSKSRVSYQLLESIRRNRREGRGRTQFWWANAAAALDSQNTWDWYTDNARVPEKRATCTKCKNREGKERYIEIKFPNTRAVSTQKKESSRITHAKILIKREQKRNAWIWDDKRCSTPLPPSLSPSSHVPATSNPSLCSSVPAPSRSLPCPVGSCASVQALARNQGPRSVPRDSCRNSTSSQRGRGCRGRTA